MNFNAIFGVPPAYTQALMDEDARQAMQARAGNTGLAALGLSLLANSSGSAAPIPLGGLLARGFGAGMQAAQGVYGDALTDWKVAQAMKAAQREEAEAARKDELQKKMDDLYARGFTTDIPAQYQEFTVPGMYRPQAPAPDAVAPDYSLVQEPSSTVSLQVAPPSTTINWENLGKLAQLNPQAAQAAKELLELQGYGKDPEKPFWDEKRGVLVSPSGTFTTPRDASGQPLPRPDKDKKWHLVDLMVNGKPQKKWVQEPSDLVSPGEMIVGAPVEKTGANVTVNMASSRNKEFGEYANNAFVKAANADTAATDIEDVALKLKGLPGGPLATAQAAIGKYLPDTPWGKIASLGELAKTIQATLAPKMREAGSGSTSDMEMKSFMDAIPTLATTPDGRALMAKYARRIAERTAVYSDIVNEMVNAGEPPSFSRVRSEMKKRLPDALIDEQDRNQILKESTPTKPQGYEVLR